MFVVLNVRGQPHIVVRPWRFAGNTAAAGWLMKSVSVFAL